MARNNLIYNRLALELWSVLSFSEGQFQIEEKHFTVEQLACPGLDLSTVCLAGFYDEATLRVPSAHSERLPFVASCWAPPTSECSPSDSFHRFWIGNSRP